MMISGFTFVRNAVMYDYPVVESIRSMLPLVNELVVAVGDSQDGTRELVSGIADPKIRIVDTVWDEALRQGGHILAQQTDVALAHCSGSWCIYLQADEVLHQDDYDAIRHAIARADADTSVEALLFHWKHFYASYDWLGVGRQWYRREVRIIRNTGTFFSFGDAQGFRIREGDVVRKPRAMQIDATIYHYGWVKPPDAQQRKQLNFNRYWHDDAWIRDHVAAGEAFDYTSCYAVEPFRGSHPDVMHERIAASVAWTSFFDPKRLPGRPPKVAILDAFERLTGIRVGEFRNYQLL